LPNSVLVRCFTGYISRPLYAGIVKACKSIGTVRITTALHAGKTFAKSLGTTRLGWTVGIFEALYAFVPTTKGCTQIFCALLWTTTFDAFPEFTYASVTVGIFDAPNTSSFNTQVLALTIVFVTAFNTLVLNTKTIAATVRVNPTIYGYTDLFSAHTSRVRAICIHLTSANTSTRLAFFAVVACETLATRLRTSLSACTVAARQNKISDRTEAIYNDKIFGTLSDGELNNRLIAACKFAVAVVACNFSFGIGTF
jgi:hypothetical protein